MGEDTTQEFPKNSLAVMLARFDSLDSRMDSFETAVKSRMDSFESRLTSLDEKVDRRLMETRPIWERVLSRLDSIEVRLDSLESRVGSLESQIGLLVKGVDRIEQEFEDIGLKFRTFQKDLLRMQTRQEKLTERFEKIENPPAAEYAPDKN